MGSVEDEGAFVPRFGRRPEADTGGRRAGRSTFHAARPGSPHSAMSDLSYVDGHVSSMKGRSIYANRLTLFNNPHL